MQEILEGIRQFISPHTKSVKSIPEVRQPKGPHIGCDEMRAAEDGSFTREFNKAQIGQGHQTPPHPLSPVFSIPGTEELTFQKFHFLEITR